MLIKMMLSTDERERVYTREELFDFASKRDAKVLASHIYATNRYKIIDTISGGDDLVFWNDRYGNNTGLRNLIIAESIDVK